MNLLSLENLKKYAKDQTDRIKRLDDHLLDDCDRREWENLWKPIWGLPEVTLEREVTRGSNSRVSPLRPCPPLAGYWPTMCPPVVVGLFDTRRSEYDKAEELLPSRCGSKLKNGHCWRIKRYRFVPNYLPQFCSILRFLHQGNPLFCFAFYCAAWDSNFRLCLRSDPIVLSYSTKE